MSKSVSNVKALKIHHIETNFKLKRNLFIVIPALNTIYDTLKLRAGFCFNEYSNLIEMRGF